MNNIKKEKKERKRSDEKGRDKNVFINHLKLVSV
jgi:hypothetical protein